MKVRGPGNTGNVFSSVSSLTSASWRKEHVILAPRALARWQLTEHTQMWVVMPVGGGHSEVIQNPD